MSFNSPFWNFFDSINDEVDQFNRLLASNGFNDRVKVSPSTKAVKQSGESNDQSQVSQNQRESDANRSLIFPSLFNSPSFFSQGFDIVPPVDILDNESNYELHVSIPGASKDKINLDFNPENNQITITGEIPGHSDDSNLKIKERKLGKFERHIKLPQSPKLDEENIKANYSNGVLVLKIPKLSNEKGNSRRIEISSSESWNDETETTNVTKEIENKE
ncbi:Heat shock protein 26 [Wickerhamomyces ciferrii]|uniref:Heat shock protein 26 n=1 Tax=Wickerhamomyces ciferrii (strain ATCC 14091 / BCRC 22168 / CBS 111 / JCM 3599 / NBRC 0793 / NRRL Y-1031 F-60-10) TaxID=1206466 RepID=K0KH84_WICCF|nr:Heat shock protein 26 [Wickerhamomyces ciferrii]CCH42356.1 Heat shock protein 26 [Wickerhamomyces ciferrii]